MTLIISQIKPAGKKVALAEIKYVGEHESNPEEHCIAQDSAALMSPTVTQVKVNYCIRETKEDIILLYKKGQ